MITLNKNYARNVDILKENLRRGMTASMANRAIDGQEAQFKRAGLFNEQEQDYINQMRACVIQHFTHVSINVA
jgi:hypothetical protein